MDDVLVPTDLVIAVRAGDVRAREALVAAWLPVVLRWSTALAGPAVDPEDVAHDVLILALSGLGRLREPASFPAWLFGITRRIVADKRRSAWLRRWMPGSLRQLVAPDGPPVRRERDDTTERVQRLLDRLPDAWREALVLCDVEEYTDEEAAEMLGVPLGTLKSRLRRGRERFERLARADGLAP